MLLGARDRLEPVKRAGAKQASPRVEREERGQGPHLRRRLHHRLLLVLLGGEEQEAPGEYSSFVTGHSRLKMIAERQQQRVRFL